MLLGRLVLRTCFGGLNPGGPAVRPDVGQEGSQFVGRWFSTQGVQSGQHLPQIRPSIPTQMAARPYQRIQQCDPFARLRIAHKFPTRSAHRDQSQRPLQEIVIQRQTAVVCSPGRANRDRVSSDHATEQVTTRFCMS